MAQLWSYYTTPIIQQSAVFVTIVALMLLGTVNYQLIHLSTFVPLFSLMAVFYWGIHFSDALSKWTVLILGLIQDMLYGTPIGTTSFLLLILYAILQSQRRYLQRESFPIVWLLFLLTAIVYACLEWVVYSLYWWDILPMLELSVKTALSILLYPLIHMCFYRLHMMFLKMV